MVTHHVDVFKYADSLGFGEIHFKMDHETGLYVIIAIHNTKRGPALGGCRWLSYKNVSDAIYDALRLAQGMTYKAAISHLAHGGGKAVIMRPQQIKNKEAYFASYAKFVHELGGIYITAVDSGTTSEEMDIIAKYTPYVTSTTATGNPSYFTALGVLRSIEATVKYRLAKDNLDGIHIAIQGVGQVGYYLAKECYQRGAKLTIADSNQKHIDRCIHEFKANVVSPDEIFSVHCDIFSPCALGAALNTQTIPKLTCKMIVGSANNQLAEPQHGKLLHRMGILYAPDYVANAGGLIHASGKYYKVSDQEIIQKVEKIYETLLTIYERSEQSKQPPSDIADALALEILQK